MNIKQFLKQFSKENPEYADQANELLQQLKSAGNSQRDTILLRFFQANPDFHKALIRYREQDPPGKQFPVYTEIPHDLKRRLENAKSNDHLKSWAETVNSIPQYTTPLPNISGAYIKQARKIWEDSICGNEEILKIFLRHAVEYGKTGEASPILLSGPPGIGKSLIAQTYGAMLHLPCICISAPSAAFSRGLSGGSNFFTGAGAGSIAQAMIDADTGNPVICIDEIDKAARGHTGSPDMQHELLSALDDSNTRWYDNYIEMHLDISHIPFVFTANDLSCVSRPLLDRMEVIEMLPPTKETLHDITQKHFIPKIIRKYDTDQVQMSGEAADALVEQLWKSGLRSCRPYQDAVKLVISDAYLKALETEKPVHISTEDVQVAVRQFCTGTPQREIGFLSA